MSYLSEEQKKICYLTGVSESDYLAAEHEERSQALNRESAKSDSAIEAEVRRMFGISEQEAAETKAREAKLAEARQSLTEEERKICLSLGIDPIEYWEKRVKEAAKTSRASPSQQSGANNNQGLDNQSQEYEVALSTERNRGPLLPLY